MKRNLRLKAMLWPVLTILTSMCLEVRAQRPESSGPVLSGIITDTIGSPISGATVAIKGTAAKTLTNNQGQFTLQSPEPSGTLVITYLGHQTINEKFDHENNGTFHFVLISNENMLEEVEVSTGYQVFNKEQVPGSVFVVDSATLARSNSTGILERLDGVTSGLVFNRNKTLNDQSDIIIRGRSTLFGDDKPLIVVDNFPYEGDINALSPNDVKQITILKDASAASIWGTRAGNGVIVITTKSGDYGTKIKTSLTSNLTVGEAPDLFKAPWFGNSEWITILQDLYHKGTFNTALNNGYSPVPSAVNVFHQKALGLITAEDSLEMINSLKPFDIRRDMSDYIYRQTLNQQYAMNLSGGSANSKFYLSANYDRNLSQKKTDSYDRLVLNANNVYGFFDRRLELSTGIQFTSSRQKDMVGQFTPYEPYARLVDEQGIALPATDGTLGIAYADTAGKDFLLDWAYRPLNENRSNRTNTLTAYRINTGLNYRIAKGLNGSLLYQYQRHGTESGTLYGENSYTARNEINRISQIDRENGAVLRPIPLGAIMDIGNTQYFSNYGRLQLNYQTGWADRHSVSAIAGFEVRDDQIKSQSHRLYGYNDVTGTNGNSLVNFNEDYPVFYSGGTTRIAPRTASDFMVDRYVSYYINASYTYGNTLTLNGSARKDESNLFGVKPNQKGVPLWSAGLLWNLANEPYYSFDWLPVLRIRLSYGYTGNVSKSISAYLTANASGLRNTWGASYNTITNPPNPSLSWERVKVLNGGIDFGTGNGRVSGSIEPYWKSGVDLIGESPLAPQTGLTSYTSNSANTSTRGVDVTLHTVNARGRLSWNTDLIVSWNKDKVTAYHGNPSTNQEVIERTYNSPIVGYPFYAIYGYKWAGLDKTGSPQIYFNGEKSTNYNSVRNSQDYGNINYIGSLVPELNGGLRNTLTVRSFQLSFNITFRSRYYIRRPSLDNGTIYTTAGFMSRWDYDNRWQQPGDELVTDVPALIYPSNLPRNDIYKYADILVVKGDNIRLQDIRLSWNYPSGRAGTLQFFAYLNNVCYLWRANQYGLDPDNPRPSLSSFSAPRTAAIGVSANF